jgi:hypothetical protein
LVLWLGEQKDGGAGDLQLESCGHQTEQKHNNQPFNLHVLNSARDKLKLYQTG